MNNKNKFLNKTVILYSIVCLFTNFLSQAFGQQEYRTMTINKDIQLTRLSDSFYMHTSWFSAPGFGRFSSNGLILIVNGKALIIDTPMDNQQTEQLYNYMLDSMNVTIETLISGHSHEDCMGGISFLHSKGVHSIALDLTNQKCIEQNLPLPKQSFSDSLILNFYGNQVICKYFGPGHTIDNIVVYFPAERILFGGCLIKAINSRNLGNIKEAKIDNWAQTVKLVKLEYADAKIVIPGHGSFGDTKLLSHTIELVKVEKQKE
ncbi:MAG: subclass B1 metallo-beta-lactamase [Bacteroidales bacterium]|nr:subclass B1 metallo-beta-lactamase [Bacteroidales bacterium]